MSAEPSNDPAAERLLARHAERRRQGLATVSVLAGRPSSGRAWASGSAVVLSIDPSSATDAATLATAVLAAACRHCALLSAAIADLSRRTGRPPSTVFSDRTHHDLDHLLSAVPDDDRTALVRTICTFPVDDWPAELSRTLPGWRAIESIDRLLVDPPAVWVVAPSMAGWLATAAGPLAALATAVARWPVGVTVSADALAPYLAAAGDGRGDLLIRSGVVTLASQPVMAPPAAVVDSDPDDDDPARSAAERALFEMLDAEWPGLFALNQLLPFPFGPRPAEADLFAASLRLAIEVDGYHHFGDPERYRRDRRKDWAYHVNGYHVTRVLAEDVMIRPVEILDSLRPLVDHCRGHSTPGGPTTGTA